MKELKGKLRKISKIKAKYQKLIMNCDYFKLNELDG